MGRFFIVFTLLGVPAQGFATCPDGSVRGALEARLDQSAVDLLKAPLLAALPSELNLPTISKTLYEGGFGLEATIITLENGVVDMGLSNTDVHFDEGGVAFETFADLTGTSDLDLQLSGLPNATCAVAFTASNVHVMARLAASVTSCEPSYDFTQLDIEVVPDDVTVEMSDCGLYGDLFNLVYGALRDIIVNYAVTKIESIVTEVLPPWMASFTSQMFADGVTMLGMRFDVAMDGITVTPGGMVLSFAANVTPTEPRADCLPKDAELPAHSGTNTVIEPLLSDQAMVSLAARDLFIERVLESAWYLGWLCFDSRDHDLTLGDYVKDVMPGAEIDFTAVADVPPKLKLAPGSDTAVRVILDELAANLFIKIGDADPAEVATVIQGTLDADISVDPLQKALMLQVRGMTLGDMLIDMGGVPLGFSEDSLRGFITNMAMPLFTDSIGALPVASTMFADAPVAVNLDDVRVSPTHVVTEMSMWPKDPNDHTNPETVAQLMCNPCRSSDVAITTSSWDDETPRDFLRHEMTVDGVAAEAPVAGIVVPVSDVIEGEHVIEVAAVDLNGNVDLTPVELTVMIDDTPPVVVVHESPLGMIEEQTAHVSFAASDDLTSTNDLTYRYTVGLVSDKNEPDAVLEEADIGRRTSFDLANLPDDSIIRVRIFARDAAGNEGVVETGFGIETSPSFSCAAAGATPLWVVVFFGLVRRYRRRVA